MPSAYGYYAFDHGAYRDLTPTPVRIVIGLSVPASGTGFAVDGVSANPPQTFDADGLLFLTYQQNVDVNALHLVKLELTGSMQASQFNMIGTNPQFFRNIYGVDYNQNVAVNLWRPQEQDCPLRTEPIVGRNGMFRLTPSSVLAPGRYVIYSGEALHRSNMIFGTRSAASTNTVFYFDVRGRL